MDFATYHAMVTPKINSGKDLNILSDVCSVYKDTVNFIFSFHDLDISMSILCAVPSENRCL